LANEGALKAIQTALYSTLHGDAIMATLTAPSLLDGTAGVFNDVPDEQEYPHVQIGTATAHPWHTMGGASVGRGWNDTVTVHIWSRYQGDIEALTILDRVVALLDHASLTVSGYGTAISYLDEVRVLVEAVKKVETYHIPAVFRIQVHQ